MKFLATFFFDYTGRLKSIAHDSVNQTVFLLQSNVFKQNTYFIKATKLLVTFIFRSTFSEEHT